jgi:predicted transcriptional regulator
MSEQRPSRLELYIEILRALEKLQASNLITIQEATNLGQSFLCHAMNFLEEQNLIRKESVENQTVYMTTPRGDRISRYFTGEPQEVEPDEGSTINLA